MAAILIEDLEEAIAKSLKEQAMQHGQTVEAEARTIPTEALRRPTDAWATANALREKLARCGRQFSDSVELIREDRDR
jgi:plasmid stability protein